VAVPQVLNVIARVSFFVAEIRPSPSGTTSRRIFRRRLLLFMVMMLMVVMMMMMVLVVLAALSLSAAASLARAIVALGNYGGRLAGRGRIFVVEDDDDDGHVVAAVLAEALHRARTAGVQDLLAELREDDAISAALLQTVAHQRDHVLKITFFLPFSVEKKST